MGDLIEVKDTFTIQLQRRMSDGKPDAFELCFMYPEYMDHDNVTVWYKYERDALDAFENVIKSVGRVW